MKQYLDLLRTILDTGIRKANRTGVETIGVFGHQMRFNLTDGFPLVTTKKIHTRSVLYELFWMLNGDTNVEFLNDHGVTIWNEWADANYRSELGYPRGQLGPVYGAQWRDWRGASPRDDVDQIAQIVNTLRRDPYDRRIILSAWNAADVPRMKLPPCHLLAQFNVNEGRLSCHMYIRSWDVFLGGPFNIAQYAFLTHMLSHTVGMPVGDLIVSSGDTHLYTNHLEQAKEQLRREPRPLPMLVIHSRNQDIGSREHGKPQIQDAVPFQFEDFELVGYDPHPHIRASVAV